MNLPTLYKKTSTGAIEQWRIDASQKLDDRGLHYVGVIVTTWGQLDSLNPQQTLDVIAEGKNKGRSNSTTPGQQAEKEATSQWEGKLKKGYVQSIEAARAGEVDAIIEGGVNPMLAKRFDEQGDKIEYPAFAQPKFDGHRCIAVVKHGKATLWSRTRKPITGLPHIVSELEALAKRTGLRDIIFDGEAYVHSYRNNFEDLTSFIRNPSPKPGHEVVQYHVYDVVGDQPQNVRLGYLKELTGDTLIPVETVTVNDEEELMAAFERFLSQGYEGAMVRNYRGKYVGKRSADLQKIKEFQDAEFMVVGVEEGRGKLAGHAIFVCAMAPTNPAICFRAKMKGKTEDLKKYFEHPELAVGKQLTVKYQGLTNKNGVPRFPRALRFKEEV